MTHGLARLKGRLGSFFRADGAGCCEALEGRRFFNAAIPLHSQPLEYTHGFEQALIEAYHSPHLNHEPHGRAQPPASNVIHGITSVGKKPIRVSTKALQSIHAKPPTIQNGEPQDPNRSNLRLNPKSPKIATTAKHPKPPHKAITAAQAKAVGAPATAQTLGTSFTSDTLAGTNPTFAYPPDSMGAVGPTQYVVGVNGRLVTFNKSTGAGDGVINTSMDSFFNAVRNGQGTSDPRVRYDRLTSRWFITIINVAPSTGNRVLIAMSDGANGGTITAATVWSFFYFDANQPSAPSGFNNLFLDYETLGIDNNALYIGGNMFGSSFAGTNAYVVRKSSLTSGGPIVVTEFANLTGTTSGAGLHAAGG